MRSLKPRLREMAGQELASISNPFVSHQTSSNFSDLMKSSILSPLPSSELY